MSVPFPGSEALSIDANPHRPRRLRRTPALRRLTAEMHLVPAMLVQPIFVRDGIDRPREIRSMSGMFQHSVESAVQAAATAAEVGVGGIILFGIPSTKDEIGAEASDPDGIMQRALRAVVREVGDKIVVMADINLDEYTTHGHSGVLGVGGDVDNDPSIIRFAEVAVAQAEAGAHVVAPSGMMDGQVGAIRRGLDSAGHQSVAVMAYAVKYASTFYGPFREAVESSLVGNRRTYQQYPGNIKESIREVLLDAEEGADIVMVKPALPYLDIIAKVTETTQLPVAAYQASGEYAMIEAAASQGLLNRNEAIRESLLAIRRAGATNILTYWATEAADAIARGADF